MSYTLSFFYTVERERNFREFKCRSNLKVTPDTKLDLLPSRSEHFPIHPNFEKYYYWPLHCSVYSLDIPGRGEEAKRQEVGERRTSEFSK